jgi:Ca2+/Na+ antiporter
MKKYAEKILEGALSKVGEWLLLLLIATSIFLVHWARGLSSAYRTILTILLIVCCLGFLCFLVSYRRQARKKRQTPPEPPSTAGTPAVIPPPPKSPGSWDEAAVRAVVVGKPQFTPRHLRPEDMRMHRPR